MNVLIILADGFEETEMITPFDYFLRAGFNVELVSIKDYSVKGAHGLVVQADSLLVDVNLNDYDAVFLPGGGVGVKNLLADENVKEFVCDFAKSQKWILAICAAPLVLGAAGVLKNRKATCYPGCESDLICGEFLEDRVVVDKNIITSRGAGSAEEFAFVCIAKLGSVELSEKIKKQVVAR